MAWEQGGKDESDRWGVMGWPTCLHQEGIWWGREPQQKAASALLTPSTAITRGGMSPLLPMQLDVAVASTLDHFLLPVH